MTREMGDRRFFLCTEVATLAQLDALDLSCLDRVYLGNPYCVLFKDNLLSDVDGLSTAVKRLRSAGVSPIVSLIAMPSNEQLPALDGIIDAGISAAADGFEVHSAGVLHHLSQDKRVAGFTIVTGGFANVYTRRTAALYGQMGASVIVPNYELPQEAVDSIASSTETPLELLVHGKIPLGLSEKCLLVQEKDRLSTGCPESCTHDIWLEFHRWSLRSLGTATYSGKDLCRFPQLPVLWSRGYRNFRITGLCESGAAVTECAKVYRKALQRLDAGLAVDLASIDPLKSLSKYGFCNGYLSGRSGCEWIEQAGTAPISS